jgi:hypothetical protein
MTNDRTCISLQALVDGGVAMLCQQEAQRRNLPEAAVARVRDAAFNKGASEADRVAAEQAVAAVLIRQVRSTDWREKRNKGAADSIIVAQFLAVAGALANRSAGSPDAARDGNLALRRLRHCLDESDRGAVLTYCSDLDGILGPPIPKRTRWRARARGLALGPVRKVGNITVTVLRALKVVQLPGADIAFDPDPWRAPEAEKQPEMTADALAALLAAYASQFGSYTTMLWQVPALSLTAQAFLMTIALGGDSTNVARIIATLLSLVISVASISLMHDQRGHAMNHGVLALRISRKLQLAKDIGDLQVEDAKPAKADAETVWVAVDHGIYHLWNKCLGLFIFGDVIIIFFIVLAAATGEHFGR